MSTEIILAFLIGVIVGVVGITIWALHEDER